MSGTLVITIYTLAASCLTTNANNHSMQFSEANLLTLTEDRAGSISYNSLA